MKKPGKAVPTAEKARKAPRAGGGGDAKARSKVASKKDSCAEKNSAKPKPKKSDDRLSLETIVALLRGNIEVMRGEDGEFRHFDPLLKEAFLDRDRGLDAIQRVCQLARQVICSLDFWAKTKHNPEVAAHAQIALADVLASLRADQYFTKLAKPADDFGEAFALRWHHLVSNQRADSQYAAVRKFKIELSHAEDEVIASLLEQYPKPLADDAPVYVKNLAPVIECFLNKVMRPGEQALVSICVEQIKSMMRMSTDEVLWSDFYCPLAAEIWPKFARENLEFKGWAKVGKGLPLSARKRCVDERPDLGFERMASRIKSQVKSDLAFARNFHGDGFVVLPDGKVIHGFGSGKQ